MTYRWPYLAAVALLLAGSACKRPTPQQPVVVHVFRDLNSPYAHQLDHRILDFQATNPRLPSGAPVVIQSINEFDYKGALSNNFAKNVKAEVVILNAATDVADVPALNAQLAQAMDICGAVRACPANVPAFATADATGDRAAGAQIFVTYLGQQKQPVVPPAPATPPAQTTPAKGDSQGKTN